MLFSVGLLKLLYHAAVIMLQRARSHQNTRHGKFVSVRTTSPISVNTLTLVLILSVVCHVQDYTLAINPCAFVPNVGLNPLSTGATQTNWIVYQDEYNSDRRYEGRQRATFPNENMENIDVNTNSWVAIADTTYPSEYHPALDRISQLPGGSGTTNKIWYTRSLPVGNYTVPLLGCRLAQMITLGNGDIVNISGNMTASLLPELAAVGGTPDASNPKRHFKVTAGAELHISHLQLTGGKTCTNSGDIPCLGGSIYATGSSTAVRASHVLFAGCGMNINCAFYGGAICAFNGASVSTKHSTFASNRAIYSGGAIFAYSSARVTITHTRFEGNWARIRGGAVVVSNGNPITRLILDGENNTFAGNSCDGDVSLNIKAADRCSIFTHDRGFLEADACPAGTFINTAVSSTENVKLSVNHDFTGCPFCTLSTSTEGNHSVPAPGCQLSQMVTVSGTMNVSGVAGKVPLHELVAVGGTPTASDPKRHFKVTAGAELHISHLQLTGGKTCIESSKNCRGGSIRVYGSGSKLNLDTCVFSGCGGGGPCAAYGGALYGGDDAVITIHGTTFLSLLAKVGAGAAYFYGTNLRAQITSSTFKGNKVVGPDGDAAGAIIVGGVGAEVFLDGGQNVFEGNSAPARANQILKNDGGSPKLLFATCPPGTFQPIIDASAVYTIDHDFTGCPFCTLSTSTEGNHTVPAPGCQLSQMVTVSGTMNVSGVAGASPLHELAAVGGTPDASHPKRHFEVDKGSKLYLSHLKLIGGRVCSDQNVDECWGGSIFSCQGCWNPDNAPSSASGSLLEIYACAFEGCDRGVDCAYSGGAIFFASGVVNIRESIFLGVEAHNAGAIYLSTAVQGSIEDSTFHSCTASVHGGGALAVNGYGGTEVTIRKTSFLYCTSAGWSGGAMNLYNTVTVRLDGGRNVFVGNTATDGGKGKQIYKDSSNPSLHFDLCPPGRFQPGNISPTEKYFIDADFTGCPNACPGGKTTANFPEYAERKESHLGGFQPAAGTTWSDGRLRGFATSSFFFQKSDDIQGVQWSSGDAPDTFIGLVHAPLALGSYIDNIDFSLYIASSGNSITNKILSGEKSEWGNDSGEKRESDDDVFQLRVNSISEKVEVVKNSVVISTLTTGAWQNGDKLYVTTAWSFQADLFYWQWVASDGTPIGSLWHDQATWCTVDCPAGYYCPGTAGGTLPCPEGEYSVAGASSCDYTATTCPSSTYANASTRACEACPEGKSNDGTGLTDVSQCLGAPSSLEVHVVGEDQLIVRIGRADDSSGVAHYHVRIVAEGQRNDWCSLFSCVAYYPFDGDANDHSGQARHASLQGDGAGYTSEVDGFANQALSLAQDPAAAVLPGSAWLGAQATWTILAFVKCSSCGNFYCEPSGTRYRNKISGATSFYDNYDPSGHPEITETGLVQSPVPDDIATTWHHWAVVSDATGVSFYLDGVKYGKRALEVYTSSSPTEATIGRCRKYAHVDDGNFIGAVDEVYIMTDVLSDAQVNYFYQKSTAPTTRSSNISVLEPQWKFHHSGGCQTGPSDTSHVTSQVFSYYDPTCSGLRSSAWASTSSNCINRKANDPWANKANVGTLKWCQERCDAEPTCHVITIAMGHAGFSLDRLGACSGYGIPSPCTNAQGGCYADGRDKTAELGCAVYSKPVPLNYINSTEDVPGAHNTSFIVHAHLCNLLGCSLASINASAAPPCHPPRSYLKDGLCWACPPPPSDADTPAGCLCPANTYANATSRTCEACPAGTSNDGTGLTDASQCLGAPSSLEVLIARGDALSVRVGYPDDDGGANVTHYQVMVNSDDIISWSEEDLGAPNSLSNHFHQSHDDSCWKVSGAEARTVAMDKCTGSQVYATGEKSSGKWFVEIAINEGQGFDDVMIGLYCTLSGFHQNNFGWYKVTVRGDPGEIYYSKDWPDERVPYGKTPGTYVPGDIVGLAYDADVGSVEYYLNGVSQGVAVGPTGLNPAKVLTITGQTCRLYVMDGTVAENSATFTILAVPKYSIPKGYKLWTISGIFYDVRFNKTSVFGTNKEQHDIVGVVPAIIASVPILASAYACNTLGCGKTFLSASTSPPCSPPTAYLKNGLCWACPTHASSSIVNATKCDYSVSIIPMTIIPVPVTLAQQPSGPAVQVAATILRNITKYYANITYAIVSIFHTKTNDTWRWLAGTTEWANKISVADIGTNVLIDEAIVRAPSPSETGNWTMNATVQTNHTFVGAIPLHVQVKACIETKVCGDFSDAVSVPLVHAMSQPPPPLLQNQADSYNLSATLKPPAFRGAGIPVVTFEVDAIYELRCRLASATESAEIRTINVSAASNDQVVVIENLLGAPAAYECQTVLHLGDRSSAASAWSNRTTTAKTPEIPSLADYTPAVDTITETSISLTIDTPWTGTPPLFFFIEWFPKPDCGERTFDSPEAQSARQNASLPVTVPQRLQPETEYTLRISIVVARNNNAVVTGDPSQELKVTTDVATTVRHVAADGDDIGCANASLSVACRNIHAALKLYPFKGFHFQVSAGTFNVSETLRFRNTKMALNGTGIGRTIALCVASPCVNLTEHEVPTFLAGITFRKQDNAVTDLAGMHAVSLVSALILRDCSFENFNGALFLSEVSTAVQLLRVHFARNHGVGGAAVAIDSCSDVLMSDCIFDHNLAEENGGAILVTSTEFGSVISLLDATFTGNIAQSGGAIFADRSSVLNVERTAFIANDANAKGGAVVANAATMNMQHVLINSTQASSALECTASLMRMQHATIANSSGSGLAGSFCSADMRDCHVDKNNDGGIRLSLESNLAVYASLFSNNRAIQDGGAISCSACASVSIRNSEIRNNSAARGGAIAILGTPSTTINASMLHNRAQHGGGGGIFWMGHKPNVMLSRFDHNTALYGADIASGPQNCSVSGPLVISARNIDVLEAIVIKIADHYGHQISDLTLTAATATVATRNATNAPVLGTTNVVVKKADGTATFDDLIVAAIPGAHMLVFTVQVPGVTLTTYLQVQTLPCERGKELRAFSAAGYQCQDCAPGMYNSNSGSACKKCGPGRFSGTEAGRFACSLCLPGQFTRQEGAIECVDCDAGMFAAGNGSMTCVKCPDGQFQNNKGLAKCNVCENEEFIPNEAQTACVQPTVDTSVPVAKNLERRRLSDHSLSCSFELPTGTNPTDYTIVAQASATREFSKGDMQVQVSIVNRTLTVVTEEPVHDTPIYFRMRLQTVSDSRRVGLWATMLDEYNLTDSCTAEEYLNNTATATRDWTCDTCPKGAKCDGNIRYDGVRGKFGYWRVPGPAPQVFRKCLFPAACLGAANDEEFGKYFNDSTLHDRSTDLARMDLPEQCYEPWGYAEACDGERCRLCSSCTHGYKRIGRARCKVCPKQSTNRALLVVGILAVILGASVIIALTIRAGAAVVTVSEATKKILLNYLQVVSLAALFPMQWPPEVENFFAVQSAISSASKALLSPDCELSWMVPAEAFYQKQIGFSLLPVIIVVTCTTVWWVAQCLRCACGTGKQYFARAKQASPGFYHNRAILSSVVLLYLSYPTMVKQGFAMLACERVGDNFWLAADLQEPCAKGRHLAYVVTVCLPQILLYILGLPLAATFLLHRNRKRLMHEHMQFRWGLLYAGYRADVFWWDLTIIMRKIVLVLVGGVFGARLGPDMQVYMALALVVIFIVLHLGMRPFDELTKAHKVLHWLELGALMVCWGTLYCGMLYWIGDRLPNEFRVLVSICIVAGNTGFTIFVMFVYTRALIRESKNGDENSEAGLKQLIRQRSQLQSGIRRSSSLKDSVKVAIHMKKAKDSVDAHATSVQALHKRTKNKREASISRLKSRLQSRNAKNNQQNTNIGAKGKSSDLPHPKQVQVEPKRHENDDFSYARREAVASIQVNGAESKKKSIHN